MQNWSMKQQHFFVPIFAIATVNYSRVWARAINIERASCRNIKQLVVHIAVGHSSAVCWIPFVSALWDSEALCVGRKALQGDPLLNCLLHSSLSPSSCGDGGILGPEQAFKGREKLMIPQSSLLSTLLNPRSHRDFEGWPVWGKMPLAWCSPSKAAAVPSPAPVIGIVSENLSNCSTLDRYGEGIPHSLVRELKENFHVFLLLKRSFFFSQKWIFRFAVYYNNTVLVGTALLWIWISLCVLFSIILFIYVSS